MSRALVLGGGGPVGICWQAGLIVGLARAGVTLADADLIVGTSAGSVVGSQLASGADLAESVALLGAASGGGEGGEPLDNQAGVEGLQELMALIGQAAAGGDAEATRVRIGQMATEATTIAEADYLTLFSVLAAGSWPDRFACTAVDTSTGEFRVWDTSSGAPLSAAVASSCAVPMVYPPVTIEGRRYMDGGMRDMLNADVAVGHDTVLAVSCTLLDLPPELVEAGLVDAGLDAVLRGTRGQISDLRDGGSQVETIVPGAEFLEVSGWGLQLMDFTRTQAAFDAGLSQSSAEAERLARFWSA